MATGLSPLVSALHHLHTSPTAGSRGEAYSSPGWAKITAEPSPGARSSVLLSAAALRSGLI